MRKLNRRHMLLFAAAALLVLINLWRWTPALQIPNKSDERREAAGQFQPEDFQINVLAARTEANQTAKRDLFQPKLAIVVKPPVIKIEPKPEPPPKTPEQLEEEAARAELTKIKCVGVVFREQKGQAFMVKGDQVYLAFIGDKVGDRFILEKIAADGVYLKDPKTNVSAQLPISGS